MSATATRKQTNRSYSALLRKVIKTKTINGKINIVIVQTNHLHPISFFFVV